MKVRSSITIALSALALAATPATAGTPQDFQARLSRAIDENMVFPRELEQSHDSGAATVRFHIDGSGRAVGIELIESSGHRTIDRAALRTIERLALPADAPAGPHLAVLQYGTEVSAADASLHSAQLDSALGRAQLAARETSRQRQALAQTGRAAAPASTID